MPASWRIGRAGASRKSWRARAARLAESESIRNGSATRFPKILAQLSSKSDDHFGPNRRGIGGDSRLCSSRRANSSCAKRRCSRPSASSCLASSDLAVDFIWIGDAAEAAPEPTAPDLPPPARPGPARHLRAGLGRGGGDRRDARPCPRRLRRRRPCPLCRLLSQRSGDDRGGARRRRAARPARHRPGAGADQQGRLPQPALGADDRGRGGGRRALQGGGAARRRGRGPFAPSLPCSTR